MSMDNGSPRDRRSVAGPVRPRLFRLVNCEGRQIPHLRNFPVLEFLRARILERFPSRSKKFGAEEGVLLFAIPLIAKANCVNWDRTIGLLNKTLISIMNQTDENFRVLIAANDDIRSLIPDDRRIEVVMRRATSWKGGIGKPNHQWRGSDQVLKQLLLTKMGSKLGAKYIMYLDADDLVRNDLVLKIREEKPRFGCVLTGGFVEDATTGKALHLPGKNLLNAEGQPMRFDQYCGSSVILTYPKTFTENWFWSLYGEGHHTVRRKMIEKSMPAVDVEEPMAVYRLNTGENLSFHVSNETQLLSWRASVLITINSKGRSLTATQRRSFGLAGLQSRNKAPAISLSE